MNYDLRADGDVEDVDEDWPPKDERVVGDDDGFDFPSRREIITIVITNDPLIMGGTTFINIFTSTISSQTLVHLLYSIFASKP